jgi:uncharacterized membrane protein YfcA
MREPERVPSPPSIQSFRWSAVGRTPRCALLGVGLVVLAAYSFALSRSGAADTSLWAMAAIFASAFASSIAGFAFSAICGALLFHMIDDPLRVVQIMMICSVGGQALMVWSLRRDVLWSTLLIFVIGAGAGLPLGVYIVLHAKPVVYIHIVGGLLVLYAVLMIFRRRPVVLRRQFALLDAVAGFLGGITGGAAAFPGAFVTIWCSFKGWSKERQRGVYQPFILIVQIIAIALMVAFGRAGADHHKFDFSGVFYLPAMLLGSALGLACFKWLNDRQFALAVNILLIVAGASFLI